MNRVLSIFMILGFGLTILGGFNVMLLIRGTSKPELVTIESLGQKNGTTNVHLSIKGYVVGKHIVESDDEGNWNRVWIPLLAPKNKWTPRPVIAHVRDVSNQGELDDLLNSGILTGVVSNGMLSLGKDRRKQFAIHYPKTNLYKAISFEINGSFPSPFIAYPQFIIGIFLLILYFGVLFKFIKIDDHNESPAETAIDSITDVTGNEISRLLE